MFLHETGYNSIYSLQNINLQKLELYTRRNSRILATVLHEVKCMCYTDYEHIHGVSDLDETRRRRGRFCFNPGHQSIISIISDET